jgi:hypothetical protein
MMSAWDAILPLAIAFGILGVMLLGARFIDWIRGRWLWK